MSVITDAIDEISVQITILQVNHRTAKHPARGQLMIEIRDLMAKRKSLREMADKARQE